MPFQFCVADLPTHQRLPGRQPRSTPHREGLCTATALLLVLLSATVAGAQSDAGSITGVVITAGGEVVDDANVVITEARLQASTDADGRFAFSDVRRGLHFLEITSPRHGRAIERVELAGGQSLELQITMEAIAHADEILVTGSADQRSRLDLATSSSVLAGDELLERLQPTLGETLGSQPGISSTSFGAGSSRPVIRGLGGDRVRMLQGGIDVGDASSTSPDHAVSAEPGQAERIEVLRGPATLLYGSSAIGGVVNVIDGLIPSLPVESTGGHLDLRLGSVNDEASATLALDGGSESWGWHVDALVRDTGDYRFPGEAVVEGLDEGHGDGHEDEEEPVTGRLPGSDLETTSVGVGVTRFFGSRGFFGASVSSYDSNYGVPGGHGHEEGDEHAGEEHGDEEEEEGNLRIDMLRQRVDLRAEVSEPFGPFDGLKARFGLVDYEHDEIEPDGAVGTTFVNDSFEGRVELVQRSAERRSGSFGLQVRSRELESIGEEAFIPRSDSTNLAVFTFQELRRGALSYQLGVRVEHQETESAGARSRSFDDLGASFGLVWRAAEAWSLGASLARSVKFPNSEELYSNGPHFATGAFEVGNPALGQEESVGLDLSVRRTEGRLTGELTLFANDFSDYIHQRFTGAEEDGLPVLEYGQADADFSGVEIEAQLALWERDHQHLDLTLFGDLVRAELASMDEPLPRIPPRRFGAGLHYRSDQWTSRVEILDVASPSRLAPSETPTAGHTLVHASLGYRFFTTTAVYDLMLRGRNLTDEQARNHVSFLKDTVPLPGRDLGISLRITF